MKAKRLTIRISEEHANKIESLQRHYRGLGLELNAADIVRAALEQLERGALGSTSTGS